MTERPPLLSVRNLTKHYPVTEGVLSTEVGRVRAVDGVDFDLRRGETLGLVGESGCGKSTLARSVLGLTELTDGRVFFDADAADAGRRRRSDTAARNGSDPADGTDTDPADRLADVAAFDGSELRSFRRRARMVFQDTTSSLDPRLPVGESVAEPLRVHGLDDGAARRRIVEDLLERVGLEAADYHRFPHELSGGQVQRIGLARALVTDPDLLVADEPVSALDVSVQADVLSLIDDLQAELGLSVLFVSHDVGVVREVSDRVAVMYLGEIVERGPAGDLFADPRHPYTEALVSAVPTPDPTDGDDGIRLAGAVPSPEDPPSGCRFHTRCHRVVPPEGYDLDGAEWRAVLDLRVGLDRPESDGAAVGAPVDGALGSRSTADGSVEDATAAVRDEFGVPDPLSDPGAERVLDDALRALVGGDRVGAEERLSAAFETVCERAAPELAEAGDDRVAACHLVDGDDAVEAGTADGADGAVDADDAGSADERDI